MFLVEGFISRPACQPIHGFSVEFWNTANTLGRQHRPDITGTSTQRTDRYYIKSFSRAQSHALLVMDLAVSMATLPPGNQKFDTASFLQRLSVYLMITQQGPGGTDRVRPKVRQTSLPTQAVPRLQFLALRPGFRRRGD